MSVADQIRDHQSRCQADLITLRMLAHGEAEAAPPRWVLVQVARSTGAVLAEAEAAAQAVQHAASRGPNPRDETFLPVRLRRLAASADDAIGAAQAGNFAEMCRHLNRFDALTSAIWAVQHAMCDPAPHRPARIPAEPRPL
jgi:hypothetical protein